MTELEAPYPREVYTFSPFINFTHRSPGVAWTPGRSVLAGRKGNKSTHTPRPFSKNGENPAPDYFSLIMANDLSFPPPRFFYFLQCIIESPHVSICSSELRQIQHSLVRPQNVISTQQVGFNPTLRHSSSTSVCSTAVRLGSILLSGNVIVPSSSSSLPFNRDGGDQKHTPC